MLAPSCHSAHESSLPTQAKHCLPCDCAAVCPEFDRVKVAKSGRASSNALGAGSCSSKGKGKGKEVAVGEVRPPTCLRPVCIPTTFYKPPDSVQMRVLYEQHFQNVAQEEPCVWDSTMILRIASFYTRGSQRIPVGWGGRMRGVQEEVAQVSCLCRRQDVL